jgi:release factor glutamine methyltransferase
LHLQEQLTTSIAEAILQGAHQLRLAGVSEARREAGSLLAHALGRDRSFILAHAEDVIGDETAETFRQYVERRADGEPLQYITGHQEFFNLDFEVTRDVLIPRPETELLIETALKLFAEWRKTPVICDVGTGSGCIAITLVHEIPGARATAIDISPDALAIARRNASRHGVAERIDFILSDCFSAFKNSDQKFDFIVSNPPYVGEGEIAFLQREVRNFEPHIALAAGADGLSIIRRLLLETAGFLKPDGFFLFEIGFSQAAAIEQLVDRRTWNIIGIYSDLQGIPRTIALRRTS